MGSDLFSITLCDRALELCGMRHGDTLGVYRTHKFLCGDLAVLETREGVKIGFAFHFKNRVTVLTPATLDVPRVYHESDINVLGCVYHIDDRHRAFNLRDVWVRPDDEDLSRFVQMALPLAERRRRARVTDLYQLTRSP